MSLKVGWLVTLVLLVNGVVDKSSGAGGTSWSFFRPSQFFNSSTVHLQEYARQKLSTLRYLRNKLNDHTNNKVQFIQDSRVGEVKNGTVATTTTASPNRTKTQSAVNISVSKREEAFGSVFKNMDSLLSFTTGPLRNMITSKQGIESLASMMMPKRDVLKKLLEIKGHLEPSLKRYLTDKYNGFLSSLVPYSENIGVPPFVLNSMKIPQDFDPRWQFIKSLLESQGGIEKFLHKMVNGEFKVGKSPEVVQSRSGDETELISDQEPDASGKGYRKQQQFYLSSFKKRHMKPGGGKVRLVKQANGVVRPATALELESLLDQTGQYGHTTYDMILPDDAMTESMYNTAADANQNLMDEMDLAMSASGHGGRGHGGHGSYGHGHGQPSYGGFLDPFTILGGLAFLTYLGLMLQNSLNRNGTGTAAGGAGGGGGALPGGGGRSYKMESLVPILPINLKSPPLTKFKHGLHQRQGRSLPLLQSPKTPVTVDQVLGDIETLWKEIEKINDPSLRNEVDRNCSRFKQCNIVWKMRVMNLEPVFASKLINSTDDLQFLNYVMTGRLYNLCEPYRSENCDLR